MNMRSDKISNTEKKVNQIQNPDTSKDVYSVLKAKSVRKSYIPKDVYSVLVACLTTVLSVLVAKLFIPLITANMSEKPLLLDQQHWEIGTTAFIEFVNPEISKKNDHYQFAIRPSHVNDFEISSFKNHKFSFQDNRLRDINSSGEDSKLMALLNVKNDYSSQTRPPILLQVNDIHKNEDGLFFKLYWTSPEEREELDKLITVIQDNPRATSSLMFDFIDTYSLMDKHVGLIMHNGHLQKSGNTITYRVQLDQKDGRFNDKDVLLYGLGKQQINYIFNENNSFKRENSILDPSDISKSTKPRAIIDTLNSNHPEIIVFGTSPPIIGKIKKVEIDNNTLIIQFKNNQELSENIIDGKLSVNIVLNIEITNHLSDNYVAPGAKTLKTEKTIATIAPPPEQKVIDAPSQNDETDKLTIDAKNNDILFSVISINGLRENDINRNRIRVNNDQIQYLTISKNIDSIIYDFTAASNPFELNMSDAFLTAFIYQDEDGIPDASCCIAFESIYHENNKMTFFISDDQDFEELMDELDYFFSEESENLILINSNFLNTAYLFAISAHNAHVFKKDDEMYIDIILKRDDQIHYASPKSLAFYESLEEDYYYNFTSTEMDEFTRIRNKKELLNDGAIRSVFDNINDYSLKAALVINDKTFLIRAKKVIIEDSIIRIKFSLLDAKQKLDIPAAGRALILFTK